jgi:hypothetical protein
MAELVPGYDGLRAESSAAASNANTMHVASAEQSTPPQPAILSTTLASNRVVVFPDANTPGTQVLVPGLPPDAQPHGIAYYGNDHALVGDAARSRIFVIQLSTASLVSTIDTALVGYDGSGTIAVSPDQSVALAAGGTGADSVKLKVIHAPFGPGSTVTTVDFTVGLVAQYQTQAIVFNSAGRAFVRHGGGISVLDPPYTSIAFDFAPTNPGSGAIAITPDGNTLMTTCACSGTGSNVVRIYTAPFSPSSSAVELQFPGSDWLDGIAIAPDGQTAIVASSVAHHAAAFTAPFFHSSPIQTFTLPPGTQGFEDVGISADGQTAIITGNSTTEPAVLIKAPFTTAGAVLSTVPISGVTNTSRGQGAVRFRPAGAAAPLQLTGAVSRKAHGGAGDFSIELPLSGEPGVECRSGGGAYRLVFTFTSNVVSGNASVTSGTGSVSGSPILSGKTMTVDLTGVGDVQKLTTTLSGVTDSIGQVLPNTPVSVNMLIGDINGSKVVNASDIGTAKSQSGVPVGAANFRSDVAASGSINATDISLVKSRSGQNVP